MLTMFKFIKIKKTKRNSINFFNPDILMKNEELFRICLICLHTSTVMHSKLRSFRALNDRGDELSLMSSRPFTISAQLESCSMWSLLWKKIIILTSDGCYWASIRTICTQNRLRTLRKWLDLSVNFGIFPGTGRMKGRKKNNSDNSNRAQHLFFPYMEKNKPW